MSKCRNEIFLGKVKTNKLTKETEVTFNVLESLPDCRSIVAKNVVNDVSGIYSRFDIPQNVFECEAPACGNTGTFYPRGMEVIYFVHGDANEWASGVITFYTTFATSVVVKVSDTQAMTNADSYTITPVAGTDGYAPIVVDLSQEGTAIGEGYTASQKGAYISITLDSEKPVSDPCGLSSINVYDSMDDFAVNSVVKISCLSGIEGDTEIDAAESTCWDEGYNTEDLSFERTITGKLLTPNYYLLNPLLAKGAVTEGFEDVTVDMEVEPITVSGTPYGAVTLTDALASECGFIGAMLADPCNITDSMLDRISIPVNVALASNQFQVIGNVLYFNASLVGKHVIISYPKAVEIEELVADERNVGTRRVRMSYPYCTSDGVKYIKVFNNVLITSFPEGITNEETEFEFTVAIRKDAFGHYYHLNRIIG